MTTQIQVGIRVEVERYQWMDYQGSGDHDRRAEHSASFKVLRSGEVLAFLEIQQRPYAIVALDDGRIIEARLSAVRRI